MSGAVDQVTGRRSAAEQLAEGVRLATAAQAEFANGDQAQAFRLVVRARLALAAAQGEMARTARAELAIDAAHDVLARKTQRERGGAPA